MPKLTCYECGQPSGEHRMGCGSKSRVDSLQWFLDSLHTVPQDVLDMVAHKCYIERIERNLRDIIPIDEEHTND